MKKIVYILAAVTIVASGVAAVSAYEAHLINVTAHVENALEVDTTAIDFGTVFPEEFLWVHRPVSLSTSAIAEKPEDPADPQAGDLAYVDYALYAEWKPVPANVTVVPVVLDAAGNAYYAWIGECLYVGVNVTGSGVSGMTVVGPALALPPNAQPVLDGTTPVTGRLNGVLSEQIKVAIDVPVFEGYYNALTDVDPKPSGLSAPTWVIPQTDPRWIPGGVDLGLDLKIQVVDIVRH